MLGVVIVAAGNGSRLGREEPKAFVPLGGASLLEHAARAALGAREPVQLVLVVPADRIAQAEGIVEQAGLAPVAVVPGGATRQQSVAAGLAALGPEVGVVLVHDAARPLVASAVFDGVAEAVRRSSSGVVPVLRVVDTLKRVPAAELAAAVRDEPVLAAVDRSQLVAAQTPQGFPRAALEAAYARAAEEYSDDAALFAADGGAVIAIDGDPRGFKITGPADLERAEALLDGAAGIRSGVGVDIHAFDESVPLWLGGLLWQGEPGLRGHSDGDALIHAVCDALLSAAGLGDLGSNFGVDDPRYAGAPSAEFLRESLARVRASGYRVVNAAVQVIAERPRIAPRRRELEAHLTGLVGAPVSVAGTTADRVGVIGAGEGVQAVAVATLVRVSGQPRLRG